MTREEANKILELFFLEPGVIISADWVVGRMEISINSPTKHCSRSFKVDPPVAVSPTVQTFTQGSGTYVHGGTSTAYVHAVGGSGSTSSKLPSAVWATGPIFTGPGTVTIKENVPVFKPKELKCCCGADSVGGKHSNYCQKGDSI